MTPILQCCVCNKSFQTPQEPDVMMLICCKNISHISCAKDWGKGHNNCMRCRELVDLTHAGKSVPALWRVVEIAAEHHPEDIHQFFDDPQKLDAPDTECASCLEEFPPLGIDYIPASHGFAHEGCRSPSSERKKVHLAYLATLTHTLMEHHSRLKENLLSS